MLISLESMYACLQAFEKRLCEQFAVDEAETEAEARAAAAAGMLES